MTESAPICDDLYILDDAGQPQPCPDLAAWGAWRARQPTKHVAQDMDEGPDGTPIRISTVFLGVDHRLMGEGPPVLWETRVVGGALDGEMDRYASRDEAIRGHQQMCRRVSETT